MSVGPKHQSTHHAMQIFNSKHIKIYIHEGRKAIEEDHLAGTALDDDVTTLTDVTSLLRIRL